MKREASSRKRAAFSLVEMLVVVAVIGVIAGIAITSITRIKDSARLVSAKRNAQEAASMSAVADAGGVVHVVPEFAGGVEATLAILAGGISAVSETGIPIELKLDLSEKEISDAAKFLSLRYSPRGIRMEYHNLGVD